MPTISNEQYAELVEALKVRGLTPEQANEWILAKSTELGSGPTLQADRFDLVKKTIEAMKIPKPDIPPPPPPVAKAAPPKPLAQSSRKPQVKDKDEDDE